MTRSIQRLPLTLMLPLGVLEGHALEALSSGRSLEAHLALGLLRASRHQGSDHASLGALRSQALRLGSGPVCHYRLLLPAEVVTKLLTLAAAADLGVSEVGAVWLHQALALQARHVGGGQGHGRVAAQADRP